MLVTHERAQQLVRLQRAIRVRGDMVSVLVEIGIDPIDRLIFGAVVRSPLLVRQSGRDDLAAAIEAGVPVRGLVKEET